jgi:hypothetical protein
MYPLPGLVTTTPVTAPLPVPPAMVAVAVGVVPEVPAPVPTLTVGVEVKPLPPAVSVTPVTRYPIVALGVTVQLFAVSDALLPVTGALV